MAYKQISPQVVAEGGTGASTLTGVVTGNGTSAMTANAVTQYGVLVGGASNAVSSTAVGTSGDVLTSNGAGMAPTYQTPSSGGSGSWIYLATRTASTDTSVEFTSVISATYINYVIHYYNIIQSDSSGSFRMLVSEDNGSSYLSTGYVSGLTYSSYNGSAWSGFSSTTYQPLITTSSSGTGYGSTATLFLYNVDAGTDYFRINGSSTFVDNSTLRRGLITGYNTSTAVDALKFQVTTGTFSGTIIMYGLKIS